MDAEPTTGAADSGPDEALPPLPARVVGVFVSPAALFDRLRERPAWAGALALVVGLGLLAQLLIPAELVREAILARVPADATPEQVEAVRNMAGVATIMRWVGTVLVPPIMTALVAGFVLLVFNVLRGGGARFVQVFAATAHVELIPAIGGLLTLPLILARRDLQTALGLHLFLPGVETNTWAYRFLSGVGPFGIWATVVLGIAVSRLYRGVSASTATILLLFVYLLAKAALAVPG